MKDHGIAVGRVFLLAAPLAEALHTLSDIFVSGFSLVALGYSLNFSRGMK